MADLTKVSFLPLKGSPLPDGAAVAVDAINATVLDLAPWPLAKPVLELQGSTADLVLVAVPAGLGAPLAAWLADQLLVVEDTSAASEGKESPDGH
jgi:hypothetical protein